MKAPRVVHLTTVHRLRDPRIFYKQIPTLQAAGFDVHLVAPHDRSGTVDGVPVRALPPWRGRARRVALQLPAFLAARRLRAALYHLHDPELIPLAWLLQRTTGARIVYDMHEAYAARAGLEGRLLERLERWCFGWADHVVLADRSLRAYLPEGLPHTVVGNYARLPQPPPTFAPRRPHRLLYAGVLSEARGLQTMLALAARLHRRDARWSLTLAGICFDARARGRAEARIDALGLRAAVERDGWADYLPHAALGRHLARAGVGLALLEPLPNYVETIPTKFYEYLQHGLPILCSDFPRWRAFVEGHGCGAAVDPGDVEGAASILQSWADDPVRYGEMSRAALEAAPLYRWEVVGARLVSLYRSLLAAPAAARTSTSSI